MDAYRSLSHTAWDCKFHIVFIPKPDPPRESSCDDDPVRMRFGVRASPGQSLGDTIQVVAPIEAISEACKIALGMFGADMMIGADDRSLDVAEHCVDPFEPDFDTC